MHVLPVAGLVALALTLAACSSEPSDNQAAASIEATIAANESSDAARGLPKSDAPSAAKAAKTLPPAFLGRWGITPADCDFSRTDTKGLVTVFADKLSFYASTAKIDALSRQSQYKMTADLNFTGEGRSWQKRTTLELVTAGTALVRTEQSPAATYRYERC
ncbi:hypothetical protein [Sphingomonas alpina]|uniref:Uncharacterized protein n=1 Tax=Sphingomonas alpina TaxID=653931 RepID=A0A7H0LDV4_9SPHN|nr:hypothetical protein [Sphingomonas alpina]QNQ07857.1 hypothetical protein H3Z74_13720 [Sphingomonas alpina]